MHLSTREMPFCLSLCSVPAANEWATTAVQPPCVAALCQQSRFGLLGNTSYNVSLGGQALAWN